MLSGASSTGHSNKRLTLNSMSKNLRNMEYAVRGAVVQEADEITANLNSGDSSGSGSGSGSDHDYPFKKIIYTNIGNPHSVGQAPLTFPRQVLALCDLPAKVGIDHPKAEELFPRDALERARGIVKSLGGGGTGGE